MGITTSESLKLFGSPIFAIRPGVIASPKKRSRIKCSLDLALKISYRLRINPAMNNERNLVG